MSSTDKSADAAVDAEHVKPTETAAASGQGAPEPGVGDVPDPDEDDLDDLDDMLDEFSAVKVDSTKPAEPPRPEASKPEPPATNEASKAPEQDPKPEPDTGESFSEEDFAKQLQAGMAEMLGELGKSPDMQAQFEDIFKQMSVEAAGSEASAPPAADAPGGGTPAKSSDAPAGDESFQETIRRTMERMQNSGEQATAAAASGNEEDFMAEMLKQLSSGDFGGGEGGEEEFSKMLMGMMEQLTNKEILYEPMKELNDKFPEWLDKNRATTSAEDLKRYEEQKGLVAEIVAKFEGSSYSDSNRADREYIVDRMQKMQAAGSPPSDLVGDMASAQEAFNGPDDQCNPQ